MQEHHARFLAMTRTRVRQSHQDVRKGRMRVGIVMGTGHGDHARGMAFAAGVRQLYQDAHILALMHFTCTMVEHDMAQEAMQRGVLNDAFAVQPMPKEILLSDLLPEFDVLYDVMPYPVGTYWNLGPTPIPLRCGKQVAADQRLGPFRLLYDGHPRTCWWLKTHPITQWDVMARSSGVAVAPAYLMAPKECAPWPSETDLAMFGNGALEALQNVAGSDDAEAAAVGEGIDYVVVHNSAGRLANTKVAPPEVFEAIVERLKALGVESVQVGGSGEPAIEGAVDRTGFRLPLTCKLIENSLALIDVEGFLPYMATALSVPAMVLFGPTMRPTFGMEGNLNLIRIVTEPDSAGVDQQRTPCPIGSCFWEGVKWAARCPIGEKGNPSFPHCQNFICPEEAAGQAEGLVKKRLESKREAEA